jgi:hypothetical protein
VVSGDTRGEVRLRTVRLCPCRPDEARLRLEVMQAAYPANGRCESAWQRNLRGVRKVSLPIHDVVVNLSMEGLFRHIRGSTEPDRGAALRHRIHSETLRLEPRGNLVEVVLAHAKLCSELRSSEPLMVAGRRRILLRRQQSIQGRLLRGRPVEAYGHTLQLHGTGNRTLIILRPSHRMDRTGQRRYLARHDLLHDPVLCGSLCVTRLAGDNDRQREQTNSYETIGNPLHQANLYECDFDYL